MFSLFTRSGAVLIGMVICFSLQAAKPNLVVYTYDSFTSDWGPGPQVKTAFEQGLVPLDPGLGIAELISHFRPFDKQ